MTSPFTGLQKLGAIPGNAISKFLEPIKSILTSIPFVGGALAALPITGVGFIEFLKSGAEEILNIGREAKKLGIDVTAMSGLLLGAGDAGEALSHGFFHMERTIGSAAQGAKEAKAIFEGLGLS